MKYLLIGVIIALAILVVILICLYYEKCNSIKDLESEQTNIKNAYQKSITKGQQTLVEENDSLKNTNEKLVVENADLQTELYNKEELIKSIRAEIEDMRLLNVKLSENAKTEEDIEKIAELEENYNNLILQYNAIVKKNKELDKENKEQNDKIEKYKQYVIELNNNIKEFEQAYVAIGGNLNDIYED